MKSIKLSVLLVVLAIIVFACKKEEPSPSPSVPPAPTYSDIIASGKWQASLYLITPPIDLAGDGNLISDLTPYINSCQIDNFYIFYKNKTFIEDNGTEKCDSADKQINSQGTWAISPTNKHLILKTSTTDSLNIDHLTKDSMVVRNYTRYDGNIRELKRTYILKK